MKYALYACTMAVPVLFVWQYVSGRWLATRKYHIRSYVDPHRRAADAVGWVILAIIALVFLTIAMNPYRGQSEPLRWIHVTFALGFVASWLVIRLEFTGLRRKSAHRRLVYPYFVFGLGMVITGLLRIHNLPA